MSSARVAVLSAPHAFDLRSADVPTPLAGEVVVRVRECGICGSDLKMWAGTHAFLRPPIVMGHEIAGTVAAVGEGVSIQAGAAVTVFPAIGCGTCFHCLSGRQQLCDSMEFFGGERAGGLASYLTVPKTHALPIPASVPTHARVLIEPLSVSVHGVKRGAPSSGERCVVLGAGAIGLFTALVLRSRGIEDIVVAEPRVERRLRAERAGFATFDPSSEEIADAVARLVRPEGADAVFECVGSQATIAAALASTRKGGRVITVGNAPRTFEIDGLALQRGERSLVGVLMYDLEDFSQAMQLLSDGLLDVIDPTELVARYPLDEVLTAFDDAKSGRLQALKAIIEL